MKRVEEIVDQAFDCGQITEADHDKVMDLIHRDGQIDEDERQILSRLFSALQSGSIRLVPGKVSPSTKPNGVRARELANAKRDAIAEDEQRQGSKMNSTERQDIEPEDSGSKSVSEENTSKSDLEKGVAFGAVAPGETPDLFKMNVLSRREDGPSFKLQTDRLLDVNLRGKVWIKTGAMVAYYGLVKFTREGFTEHGVTRFLKRAITGEGTPLTKASGHGVVYLADQGKKISIIELAGHSLVVNGKNIMAFEESVSWDITYLRQIAAMWAGGFFNVRLSGKGLAAITSHYDPITLRVTPSEPLMTDMNATVAWSGSLAPQIKTDISMRSLVGRASGESLQMRFEGDGFVVIQPYEELFTEREVSDD